MKRIPLFFLLMVFGLSNYFYAQEKRLEFQPTIGVSSPILDNGFGVYAGFNPYTRITESLYAEGQISYMYTHVSSSFLSGNIGFTHTANTLIGGRLYVNPDHHGARFFFNLLLGLNYLNESNKPGGADDITFGYSGGTFLELNRFITGLTFDTPQHLILKLGYSF